MNIYKMSKEEFKKVDKEFSKTIYGRWINMLNIIPLIFAYISLIAFIVFLVVDIRTDGTLFTEVITSIIISMVMFSLSAISNILCFKELRKYVENKKSK